jgi:hypothetical protein
MRMRSLVLGGILLVTLFAEGCCWCHRPYLFRRWWWGHAYYDTACSPCYPGGPACCDGGPVLDSYSLPPGAPIHPTTPTPGPTMPSATPLARGRLGEIR